MNNLAVIDKEFKSILKKRGMLSSDMGSEISDSWARCISNGLDPFKGPKKSIISSQELDQLLDGGSLMWRVAASLIQPLFQGGRLAALEEQAKIRLEQREKRYLEVVFRALAEVENALSREQALNARYEAFVRAEQNAGSALELAFDQYQRGLAPYTTVLESQRRAFDAQTTLIQLQNQQLKNRVNLLLALGGDY